MRVQITDATLGAVVQDVDLAAIDDAQFAEIEAAWHRHAVLVFQDQHLTDEQHLAFTRRFGRLEKGLKRGPASARVGYITNVTKEGAIADPQSLQVRFSSGNSGWHTDSSYKRVGAKASILAAHEVPSVGGETEWADMRAAYDALDEASKSWLAERVAVHSYVFSHAPHGGLELLNEREVADLPLVQHAVVRTHPATGRKNLFVGRHASHILGEDEHESRALLRQLTSDACQPPRIWKHRWQPGEIALWDNRCVLHRGHAFPSDQRRVMARSTVAGDVVDNEWALDDEVRRGV